MSVRIRVRMAQITAESKPDEAVRLLREAAALEPSAPDVLAEFGKVMASMGLYDDAIQYLKEAYEGKLERADVLSTLGFCFLQRAGSAVDQGAQRQDLLAAKLWLNRLLAKAPAYRGAHNNLGKVLLQLGDNEAAEQAFRQELTLYPNGLEALTNLGRYLAEQGSPDKAKELIQRAFDVDRRQVMLADELGRLALLQSDWDGALSWYQTAYKLCQEAPFDHPCRVDTPYQIARIAGHRKDKDAAVQYMLLAIEAGFTDLGRFKAEDDLRIIQSDPRLAQFLSTAP